MQRGLMVEPATRIWSPCCGGNDHGRQPRRLTVAAWRQLQTSVLCAMKSSARCVWFVNVAGRLACREEHMTTASLSGSTDPQPRRLTHYHRLATFRARVPTSMRFQSHCDVSLAKRIQIGVTPACASFASRSFSIARSRRAVGPPAAAIGPLRLSRLPNAPEDRGVRPLFSRRRSSWL